MGGINPVIEALRAKGRTFEHIYLARGRSGPAVEEIKDLAGAQQIKVERTDRANLDRLFKGRHHQGVVALVGEYRYHDVDDILDRAASDKGFILVLDGIQDPMNLGSLIRSAEAAGALGVILPRERSASMTPATVKASAGAAEHLPVARVVNLSRVLDELKKQGFWIIGTEASAETSLYDQDLDMKLALVIGSEGQGLRRLTREKCDNVVSIPLQGRISSLNGAVAGALAMFEYVRQTRK